MPTPQERLFALLFERAFRYSETAQFKLTSGQASRFYIDCKTVSMDAEGAFLIGNLLWERIGGLDVGGVGGMTLGADPLAIAVAVMSFIKHKPIPAFVVRKAPKGHGSGRQVEGALCPGARVVVLEDVVTTGGSTLQTLEVLKKEGHTALKVIALIDRQEGGAARIAETGIPFESLFTLDDFIKKMGTPQTGDRDDRL